jgi:hypothetical protein
MLGESLIFHVTKKIFAAELDVVDIAWTMGIFEQSMGSRNQLGIGSRTGPPGYIGWRNRFLRIEFWAS